MTFIIAAVLFIFVGAGWSYLSCDGAPSRPAIRTFSADQQDCHHGAPDDCIRTTVEAAQRGDFRGYIFCACVTSSGSAQAFVATNTSVHPATRTNTTRARNRQANPLGNDNPAVTFPVGAPHR